MSIPFEGGELVPMAAEDPGVPVVLNGLHAADVHWSLALGDVPNPAAVRALMTSGVVRMFRVRAARRDLGTLCLVDDGMLYLGIVGDGPMRELAGEAAATLAEHVFETSDFDRVYVFVPLADDALMQELFGAGFERVVDLTTQRPRAQIGVILREAFEEGDDDAP